MVRTRNGGLVEIPKDWFTPESLVVFSGATMIVWVLYNTIRKLFKIEWIAIPFILSLIVVYFGASQAGALQEPVDHLIAITNAALLFLTAVGLQETGSGGGQ